MISRKKIKKDELLRPGITFLLVFLILSVLFLCVKEQNIRQQKEQYRYIAINESNVIRDYFDTVTARAYTIRALIVSDKGGTDSFYETAENCYQEVEEQCGISLKNIAAAPGGIVRQVYPLAGNEALIGFDFMDESRAGNKEAAEAYGKAEMVVTQPFMLVQGGMGMGARLPVFLDVNGSQEFWGLVTITMDFEGFIDHVNLDSLSQMGVCYHVWYEDEDGKRVTLAESQPAADHPVTHEFSMRNLRWNISVSPERGWYSVPEYVAGFVIIVIISLLCAVLTADKLRIQEANNKLMQMAYFDALTLCHSRQYVNTVLVDQQTGQWKNPDARYSLVIADVDYFKKFNDTYGHAFGDRTLAVIADILKSHIKEENGDCVIRHGGDEFIILYHDVTEERFEGKMKSIVETVRNFRFADYPDVRLSLSAGGVCYKNPEESLYYAMVKQADEKLYETKENGRDGYSL